jgi:hypothetical protein
MKVMQMQTYKGRANAGVYEVRADAGACQACRCVRGQDMQTQAIQVYVEEADANV